MVIKMEEYWVERVFDINGNEIGELILSPDKWALIIEGEEVGDEIKYNYRWDTYEVYQRFRGLIAVLHRIPYGRLVIEWIER